MEGRCHWASGITRNEDSNASKDFLSLCFLSVYVCIWFNGGNTWPAIAPSSWDHRRLMLLAPFWFGKSSQTLTGLAWSGRPLVHPGWEEEEQFPGNSMPRRQESSANTPFIFIPVTFQMYRLPRHRPARSKMHHQMQMWTMGREKFVFLNNGSRQG